MTEMQVLFQGKNDAPKLKFLQGPVVDLSYNPKIIYAVVEEGMISGEPSVLIASNTPEGSVVLQTSLDKFIAAAIAMQEAAKMRWGWVQPAGAATFLPPDRATRKLILEQIQRELAEWDELDETPTDGD